MATQTLTTQNLFAPKPSSSNAPQERIRAYRDYLTPALHRRFTTAVGVLLFFCWIEAFVLSTSSHLLWSWFPLGFAGLHALLLLIPCLAVFIVRVANLHLGEKTTTSPAESIYAHLATATGLLSTLNTFAWYVGSAWFFCEVYIWTRTKTAELAMVDPGNVYERTRLNENPIFLRSLFVTVGVIQAYFHMAEDYDGVTIPTSDEERAHVDNAVTRFFGTSLAKLPLPFRVLTERCTRILQSALNVTLVSNIVNCLAYFTLFRQLLWRWTYNTARPFISQLPPSAPPTGLLHLGLLLWQMASAPFMLMLLWEISKDVFGSLVTQPPLKKDHPLTSEIKDHNGVVLHKSKDPNGSLINGLRSKKEVNKFFAFWELCIICEKEEGRRKTIYTEVDRKGSSTWSKVCELALKEIESIGERIKLANSPASQTSPLPGHELPKRENQLVVYKEQEELGLKKIADRTVKSEDDKIFAAQQKPDLVNKLGQVAKSWGQSPGAQDPVSPRARKYLEWGAEQVMSPEDRQRLSPQRLQKEASGYMLEALRSPVGKPFRQTFARRVNAVLFGTPVSKRLTILHAAKALTKLGVCSLKEDVYGQVQNDIPKVIRSLTVTIKEVEKFVKELQPSWTDVLFTEKDRSVEEVQELLDVLKTGLEEIVLAFGEYLSTLGLSKKDVREAKEAAARAKALPPRPVTPEQKGPEMRQRRLYN